MAKGLSWCIIVNLNTCKVSTWRRWQKKLDMHSIDYTVYSSYTISTVSHILSQLVSTGHRHFIFAGGDGTLHHGGNLLIEHAGEQAKELTIGVLPCGTGNDWWRTFGVHEAKFIECLRQRKSAPMHLLKLEWPNGTYQYAFNMMGAALDAAVVLSIDEQRSLNQTGVLKYPLALIKTLMKKKKWYAPIRVDNKLYEGEWLTVEADFGKYCGGGMYVLPHASENVPGLLLIRPKSVLRILTSIQKLYNGKIAEQPEATATHFSSIEILDHEHPLPLEADGEWLGYSPVKITVQNSILNRIV